MNFETLGSIQDRTLALRQPGWLSAGAGAMTAAMAGGAGVAVPMLVAGLALTPLLPVASAGLVLVAQVGGLALTRRSDLSFASWVSTAMSLGHAILFAGLILAAFQPDLVKQALAPVVGMHIFTLFGEDSSFILTFGPAYLAAMLAFSVFAPLSLIIFRYVAFRK